MTAIDKKLAGPLARIGPNELVTSDPGLLRKMLNVRTRYRRSDWYIGMRFDPHSDNILSQRDNALHHSLRSRMSAGVSCYHLDAPRSEQACSLHCHYTLK